MVAPVNHSGGVQSLQRLTPNTHTIQAANRQPPQQSANKLPAKTQSNLPETIDLASANAKPASNLPRGSIVDRLV